MSRVVRFREYLCLPPAQAMFTDARQLLDDLQNIATGTPALRVSINATHSGYLLNNRVYPGIGVRSGSPSWVSMKNGGSCGYDKPVLRHHEDTKDAIGRVIGQQFVQLWDDEKFGNDWRTPDSGTKPGSGFIVLNTLITDRDAQQKILDGRYKTVSTGQTSDKLTCSICAKDWTGIGFFDEEPCEHRPGKQYEVDGKKYLAYSVTGKMDYKEVSFVNHPANELAAVSDFGDSTIKLGADTDGHPEWTACDSLGGVHSIMLVDGSGAKTELMRLAGEPDVVPYGDGNVKSKVLISVPESVNFNPQDDNTNDESGYNKSQERPSKDVSEDNEAASSEDSATMTDDEFALAHIAKSMLDTGILVNDKLLSVECDFTFEDCLELIGDLQDAKLTAAQRKALKSSTYCGPNRSFPVPDVAHVKAAYKLIGRVQVLDSQQETIMASLERRAKVLGYEHTSDSLSEKGQSMSKDTATANSETTTDEPKEEPTVMEKALADAQAKIASLESELVKSKQLYDGKVTAYNELMDENSSLKTDFQRQLSSQLVTLSMQLRRPLAAKVKDSESFGKAVEDLASRTIDSLRDSISDAIPELNDAFKRGGLPSFIKDKPEQKPATQKSTQPEGNTNKETDADTEDPRDLL